MRRGSQVNAMKSYNAKGKRKSQYSRGNFFILFLFYFKKMQDRIWTSAPFNPKVANGINRKRTGINTGIRKIIFRK